MIRNEGAAEYKDTGIRLRQFFVSGQAEIRCYQFRTEAIKESRL